MPATTKHIETNFARIEAGESEQLKDLFHSVRSTVESRDGSISEVWKTFVAQADERKLADKIPGTVGRDFAKKYGTIKARGPRGQKVELQLTDAAYNAIVFYTSTDEDMLTVSPERTLIFTNKAKTAKLVEKLIERSVADISSTAQESAARRSSLKALAKKVAA